MNAQLKKKKGGDGEGFVQIATAKEYAPCGLILLLPLWLPPLPEDWDRGVFPQPLRKGRPAFSGEGETLLCKKLGGKLITPWFVQLWPE